MLVFRAIQGAVQPHAEEEGSSGKVLLMGVVGATPAQVSRALKVQRISRGCHQMVLAF